jgi:hypothetical protein
LERALQHVQSLEQESERHRTEILYAEQVAGADVSEPAAEIQRVKAELVRVTIQVNDSCIRQRECFAALGEVLSSLGAAIQRVEQSLRGVLQKREPTPDEEAVLNVLQDPRGTDLSVVIANRLAKSGSGFSVDELMHLVTSLFRKSQVIIRLEKRR